jgi:hypothetical protein
MNIKLLSLIISVSCSTYAGNTLNYINNLRLNCGASKMSYSSILSKSAKKHALYLAKNREFGHMEYSYKRFFYAKNPWQRIVKAGYSTKAVIENISFYEPTYKKSINKIMATIYHRLAFLDPKVDTIGYAQYNKIYVYDMSNSKIKKLCDYSHKDGRVSNICKKRGKTLAQSDFINALKKTKQLSQKIIIYPYPSQKGVYTKLEKETPRFLPNIGYGLPISVTFNSAYYSNVRLKKFKLYLKNKEVLSKIVTFRNDRAKKLNKNSFVLVPKKMLKRKSKYKVELEAIVNNHIKKYNWYFITY